MTERNQTNTPAPVDRILLVDSEIMMCELLQYKFESEGYGVDVEHSAEKALERNIGNYALVIIDLMGADYNGIKLIEEIKQNPETFTVSVMMISATSGEDIVVAALDAGADDFLSKPFSSRELLARIKSILRRRHMLARRRVANVVRYNGLQIDLGSGVVSIDGTPISLTRTEYLILAMLMRNRNQFFDRAEIQHEAWEEDSISERAVDTNISRLRKKLGSYGRNIVNRQGFGYGFVE